MVHASHVPHEPSADAEPQDPSDRDWTLALFFKREIVSLWSMHEPFNEFQDGSSARRSERRLLLPDGIPTDRTP